MKITQIASFFAASMLLCGCSGNAASTGAVPAAMTVAAAAAAARQRRDKLAEENAVLSDWFEKGTLVLGTREETRAKVEVQISRNKREIELLEERHPEIK